MCLCALLSLLAAASAASGAMYFGATISGESYGQTGNAPRNTQAWDLFERHAGRKVAILNQGQGWAAWDEVEVEATHARGAIPLITMGLGDGVTIEDVALGEQDAAIEKWAQEAKAWGHPFFFAPWWEMNGGWYAWGREPMLKQAWRRFHDLVAGQGATNVTWTWVVNSIWFDPESDPSLYYPGDAYVDWTALDSYNWGRNPAQPDKWLTPDQTISPTLKIIRETAPAKPVMIAENASSEYGGNKTDYVREMLATYLPHHPEIGAYLWFNWNFPKGDKRADWPIETSAPAQQTFRKAIQRSLFVPGPVALPKLTKVQPPAPAAADAPAPADLSPAAEMAGGPDLDVGADGTATVVWSARAGGEQRVFARQIAVDGSRGPALQLSAAGGDALAPQVAVAPDGTAVVAWTRWDGANFRVQERRIAAAGSPEAAIRTLSGASQDAADPQLDVAPDGTATVVWRRFDGFHPLVQVRRIAPDGTSEEPSQRLSESGQDAVEPDVAVAADGTATVVWSRFDGADSIVQERRVEADDTLEAAIENLSDGGESAVQPRV
ncbi:MAG TPA: glycosyl hydrolase, partial [Solirubrobacterales bacterium]|nr:glycosyl hydrolase [Solirubrobacterales bacterium]